MLHGGGMEHLEWSQVRHVMFRALDAVFRNVPEDCKDQIVSLAFDGTSSTTLLVDEMGGASLESPKWYNASQNQAATDYAKVQLGGCRVLGL